VNRERSGNIYSVGTVAETHGNSNTACLEEGIHIYTLGRFEVFFKERKLSPENGRSKKIWELLMHLLINEGQTIPAEEIAEAIQNGTDYTDPRSIVKNLVHRLRKKLDQEEVPDANSLIIQHLGCYGLNKEYPYWIDANAISDLCSRAQTLAGSDPELACELYKQALSLYKGTYLPECSYNECFYPARQYYHSIFIKAMGELLELLKKQHNYSEIIAVCEKIIMVEQFVDNINHYYMEALLVTGEADRARAHYEYISSLLYNELGVKPSEKLKKLYRVVTENDNAGQCCITGIKEAINAAFQEEKAFITDPETFKLLCKLEQCRLERENLPAQVGLLTVLRPGGTLPPRPCLNEAMPELCKILNNFLCKGDVFAIWHGYQAMILLPGLTNCRAETVVNRIAEKFDALRIRGDLFLKREVIPVDKKQLV